VDPREIVVIELLRVKLVLCSDGYITIEKVYLVPTSKHLADSIFVFGHIISIIK